MEGWLSCRVLLINVNTYRMVWPNLLSGEKLLNLSVDVCREDLAFLNTRIDRGQVPAMY
jgi:hypothetical protein